MTGQLRKYLRSIRGLGTVPGLISLALWVGSLCALWLDHTFPEFSNNEAFRYFYTDYDTAKSVLSTVAAASITTLGLVYSIVLVVFTTAAGNIGPRLLQRFTGDSANQFTAGLFGGTFLFSLTVLHQTDPELVPSFSIACTFLLAGLSVLQLIYFVHNASVSVTVDEEVAEIGSQLESEIESLLHREAVDQYNQKIPERNPEGSIVEAPSAGYITHLDVKNLVKFARENDTFITFLHGQGEFILEGQKLVQLNSVLNDEQLSKAEKVIHETVPVSRSRSPESDAEFSINLLIEIALRALSPGVNDTYTAVTCVDRISSALAAPVKRGLRDHVRADEDGIPRLLVPGLTLEDLINTAFHPLRRAAKNNVLMIKHIIDALGRLLEIAEPEAREVLTQHLRLILESSKDANLLKNDVDFIANRCKAFVSEIK
jgi:uncharacterized membrane protein